MNKGINSHQVNFHEVVVMMMMVIMLTMIVTNKP